VSQPVPPLRGSIIFPLDRGLTPAANTNAAAARLLRPDFDPFVPPPKFISRCDTVPSRPRFRVPLCFAFATEVRDLSGESGFLFWLADAALKRRSTRTSANTPTVELL
jgi:hypothetical protein